MKLNKVVAAVGIACSGNALGVGAPTTEWIELSSNSSWTIERKADDSASELPVPDAEPTEVSSGGNWKVDSAQWIEGSRQSVDGTPRRTRGLRLKRATPPVAGRKPKSSADSVPPESVAQPAIVATQPEVSLVETAENWITTTVPQPIAKAATAGLQRQSEYQQGGTASAHNNGVLAVAEVPAAFKASPEVIIKQVIFEGNTAFTDEQLSDVADPFLNRALGIGDLEELRVKLSQLYTDSGYVNSGAVLPGQEVEDGVITYELVEGRLEDVTIEGNGRLRSGYIADRVLQGASTPFNTIRLQKNFQMLLDDPLIDRMDGQLSPLPGQGVSRLDLRVTRAKPYNFFISANNYVSPSLGTEQLQLGGTLRNITGIGDELSLSAAASESRNSFSAEYNAPINGRDTRVRLRLSASDSGVIEEPLDTVDIKSDTTGTDLSISHPIRRESQNQYSIGAGLAVRRNENLLADQPFSFSIGETDGASRVSVLRGWQEYVRRKNTQVFAARMTLNLGLDAFDSTVHSDGRPDSEFVSLQTQIQYVRRYLEDRAQLFLKLNSQFANEELLPLERFSIGGSDTVRGYRENEVVRDQGVLLSAEWRYTFIESASSGRWVVAPFVDYGIGGNNGQFTASEILASVGAGLLWNLADRFSAQLYFGHRLQDAPNSEGSSLQDNGVHFNLRASF